MARTYLAPHEKRLLHALPPNERAVLQAFMDELDAQVIDDQPDKYRFGKLPEQRPLFDEAA